MDWKQFLEQFGFDEKNIEVAIWLEGQLGDFNETSKLKFQSAVLKMMQYKNPIIADWGFNQCMIFLSQFENAPVVWHYFLADAMLIIRETTKNSEE